VRANHDGPDVAAYIAAEHHQERRLRRGPLRGLRCADARAVWLRLCEADGVHVEVRSSRMAGCTVLRQPDPAVLAQPEHSKDAAPAASRTHRRSGDRTHSGADAGDGPHYRRPSYSHLSPCSAKDCVVRQVPGADVARGETEGQRIFVVAPETRLRS